MYSHRKIFTLIVLQAFLAFGGLFGSKAYCIEDDGDVFSANLLTGADEADNDHFEADTLRSWNLKIPAVNSSESEDYIIVIVSDDSQFPTAKLNFPAKLYVVLTIPTFALIEQAARHPSIEKYSKGPRLPNFRMPLIRTIVLNC